MTITLVSDSATIGTTEYFLASDSTVATYQTEDCVLQVWLELNNMTAAEQYRFKVYEKVNAGTARVVYEAVYTGAQSRLEVSPALIVGEGWEASLTKLTGTDRAIAWSLRKLT